MIDTVAAQGDNQIIRNAEAELELSVDAARAGAGRALPRINGVLSERQEQILRHRRRAPTSRPGRPVGSKAIAERPDFDWGPSTVRAELAALEREGYLTHPHTSAGRVPTDAGYRFYADALLARRARGPRPCGPSSSGCRRCAARSTRRCGRRPRRSPRSPTCWRSSPRRRSAPRTIHRVEVLRLQPRVVMVVVIASNGAVTKRVFTFESPVDPGLVEWAVELPERAPRRASASARGWLGDRLARPGARRPPSAASSSEIATAFTDLDEARRGQLYVDGAGAAALRGATLADLPARRRR